MKTFIIGDIHGCADELQELLDLVSFQAGRDRLFLTGDAFARGPDPLAVWHCIQKYSAQMVLGNHDVRLRQQLKSILVGNELLNLKKEHLYTLNKLSKYEREIYNWLANCPFYIKEEYFLLVHAGIHPELGLAGTSSEEFISIRCWPPQKGQLIGPRWHDKYRPIYPLIIFGHDAPKGLVVKKNKGGTYLLGLDTGCVYGGKLTGYLLEDRLIIDVESKQPDQRLTSKKI